MPLIENKTNRTGSPENCRTCVDFKTWAKQQRKSLTTTEVSCGEIAKFFKPHSELFQKKDVKKQEEHEGSRREDCPWDKDTLGKGTWGLLHTIAAHFPDEPSQQEQKDVKGFFSILSRLYPCEYCAKDFQKE